MKTSRNLKFWTVTVSKASSYVVAFKSTDPYKYLSSFGFGTGIFACMHFDTPEEAKSFMLRVSAYQKKHLEVKHVTITIEESEASNDET